MTDSIINDDECLERLIELDETFHALPHPHDGMCCVQFTESGDCYEIPVEVIRECRELTIETLCAFSWLD
jgi:hypothetical protein